MDTNQWAVSQAVRDGKPIFIRYRQDLNDPKKQRSYEFQIGVAVPLLNPTQDGLPTDSEAGELHAIEDQLDNALSADKQAVHVMTITFNGMREFVFYASEWKPEYFEQKVNAIKQEGVNPHKLQFMMQHDENWETFKAFSGSHSY